MAKANPRRANGNARNKIRARLKAQGLPCAICGRAIDYNLPPGNDWSFEVDEIVPIRKGGSPFSLSNVQAVHRVCNRLKYQQERAAEKQQKKIPPPPAQASRDW